MSNVEKAPINKKQFTGRVERVIDSLELPKGANKELLKLRFLDEVQFYEKKRDSTKKYYNFFRFSVTTGSILLPAILSLGQMDPNKLPPNFDQVIYWTSWTISLLVTISNGFLQLFSLDKNFFNYSLTVEQLKTEGWQFFGLSGKYEEYEEHDKKSYKEFCKAIETIKRKQIEQEYSGKADSQKKKEFNFAEEMEKFQDKATKNLDIAKKTKDLAASAVESLATEATLSAAAALSTVNRLPKSMPPIPPIRDIETNITLDIDDKYIKPINPVQP